MGSIRLGIIWGASFAFAAVAGAQVPLQTAPQVPEPATSSATPESDPAYKFLAAAYAANQERDYDFAIAQFQQAIAAAPQRLDIRKDLAYTFLKSGDTLAARGQFAEVLHLTEAQHLPPDDQIALEYAFLCYETKEPVLARRVFDRLRQPHDGLPANPTATEAFENIDRPLREGIARWQAALSQSPDNFSGHEELAKLAEQRDDLTLAAEYFERAWRLRPARRDLLLDLGRIWGEQNRAENAKAALLAASRAAEPRTSERANEQLRDVLGSRYPFVYEFENALKLDPSNDALRRELAYLHQAMGNQEAADRELKKLPAIIVESKPLAEVEQPRADAPAQPQLLDRSDVPIPSRPLGEAKRMGEISFEKGYLNDALRYLHAAVEEDVEDFNSALRLGETYNMLGADREAIRWFDRALGSSDNQTATTAAQAVRNISPGLRRFRTTVWMFPMISTRWANTFAYAQAKVELRTSAPVHPYASLRFIGDVRGKLDPIAGLSPQYLSERSVIVAAGLATKTWQGVTGWFEAGEAIRYMNGPGGRAIPDYRGGVSYGKMISNQRGLFADTADDGLFVSRFGNDTLLYSQNRAGKNIDDSLQFYWNFNSTLDAKRQYWANTVETGPGARITIDGVRFSVNWLRGAYLINSGNPYRPNFTDLRIGIWYAFSK
jgi:tetratricopeptide (TPR) repeat protein